MAIPNISRTVPTGLKKKMQNTNAQADSWTFSFYSTLPEALSDLEVVRGSEAILDAERIPIRRILLLVAE